MTTAALRSEETGVSYSEREMEWLDRTAALIAATNLRLFPHEAYRRAEELRRERDERFRPFPTPEHANG